MHSHVHRQPLMYLFILRKIVSCLINPSKNHFLNNTKTPSFTLLGVKLGVCFAIC